MKAIGIFVVLLAVGHGISTAAVASQERIVGGEVTSIDKYPYMVVLLTSWDGLVFAQECGGSILNNRSILTAAHCLIYGRAMPERFRVRVGSTFAHSGGVVHQIVLNIPHPDYNEDNYDNDVAILRTATMISFNDNVQQAMIAGSSYNLNDNELVTAIGWGRIEHQGPLSEQLRHVDVWTINQDLCKSRYAELEAEVTENMLCSGWLDIGGRDQCNGDSGGPLLHHNVVVGVCSWSKDCALPRYPGVNARVSRFTDWIVANA